MHTSPTTYTDLLTKCASYSNKDFWHCHIAPIYSTSESAYALFPFPKKYIWESFNEIVEASHAESQAVVCITPPLWHMDTLVLEVTKPHSMSTIYIQPRNLSPLLVFKEEVPMSVIVTAPEFVDAIKEHLQGLPEKQITLVVVHLCNKTPKFQLVTDSFFKEVYNEIHLSPGYPLLYQTKGNTNVFQPAKDFLWDFSPTTTSISSKTESDPVQMQSLILPFVVKKTTNGVLL